eukprot:SAG31_NODE_3756_length_3912_cov_99.932074_3_plen_145_part_00
MGSSCQSWLRPRVACPILKYPNVQLCMPLGAPRPPRRRRRRGLLGVGHRTRTDGLRGSASPTRHRRAMGDQDPFAELSAMLGSSPSDGMAEAAKDDESQIADTGPANDSAGLVGCTMVRLTHPCSNARRQTDLPTPAASAGANT